MPHEKEAAGKQGKSLTLTIGASEATNQDGDADTLAVGLKTASMEPALHLAEKPVVEAKEEKNGVRIRGGQIIRVCATPRPCSEIFV